MTAEFFSAVQQLVRAHVHEVSHLQRRVDSFCDPAKSTEYASLESCPQILEEGLKQLLLELKQHPLSKDGLFHVDACESFKKPRESPGLSPSHPRTPPGTPRAPGNSEESLTSRTLNSVEGDAILNSTESLSPQTPRLVEEDRSTSLRSSNAHALTSKISSRVSLMCQSVVDASIDIPEQVVQRWEALAYGVLMNRNTAQYIIHPGWLDTGDISYGPRKTGSSLAVVAECSLGKALSAENMMPSPTPAQFMSFAHRVALKQQERKAVKFHRFGKGGSSMESLKAKSVRRLHGKRSEVFTLDSLVLHPQAPLRRVWLLSCCFMFLYEVIAVSMEPFGIHGGPVWNVFEFCSAVFWTCDIFMNFISGIYIRGLAETRFIAVAKHYVRSWLVFDIVVISCQWCALLMDSLPEDVTIAARLVRIVRSFRMGRAMFWLAESSLKSLSRSTISIGKLVIFMIGLYFFVHCFACILYAVGKSDGGWISQYRDRLQDEMLSFGALHNYLVCLHWTLSQLQGNVDLYPSNSATGNLFFVVISSSCSIVALTLFVSSATDTLQDVRQQQQRKLDEDRLLHDFFHRHNIDPEIEHRSYHYLNLKRDQQRIIDCKENDDRALMMFPRQLRCLLLAEMRATSIASHPLFGFLQLQVRSLFDKICGTVLSLRLYEPNDDVFTSGEVSSSAYVIVRGEFLVSAIVNSTSTALARLSKSSALSASSSPSRSAAAGEGQSPKSRPVRKVMSGQLVSEISLWMPWVHVGDLCSTEHGQCLEISRADLIATLKPHSSPFGAFVSYAQRFVNAAKYIHEQRTESFTELLGFFDVAEVEAHEEDIINLTASVDSSAFLRIEDSNQLEQE